MKIIIGLGNLGEKYKHTRHNLGWLVLDKLIQDLGFKTKDFKSEKKFQSDILEIHTPPLSPTLKNKTLLFIKPQTFMNNSGEAVKQICNFYKINLKTDLIIIHDDIDLPFGKLKVTSFSSFAGHNGVKSIIENLQTQDFHRIRVGIESRQSKNILPTDVFVLQNFTNDEQEILKKEIFPKIKLEVEKFLEFKN